MFCATRPNSLNKLKVYDGTADCFTWHTLYDYNGGDDVDYDSDDSDEYTNVVRSPKESLGVDCERVVFVSEDKCSIVAWDALPSMRNGPYIHLSVYRWMAAEKRLLKIKTCETKVYVGDLPFYEHDLFQPYYYPEDGVMDTYKWYVELVENQIVLYVTIRFKHRDTFMYRVDTRDTFDDIAAMKKTLERFLPDVMQNLVCSFITPLSPDDVTQRQKEHGEVLERFMVKVRGIQRGREVSQQRKRKEIMCTQHEIDECDRMIKRLCP